MNSVIKKFMDSKIGEGIILLTSSILHLLLLLITYSLELTGKNGGDSIWGTATIYKNKPMVDYLCVAFIGLFILEIVLLLLGIILYLIKRKKIGFYIVFPYDIILSLFILFVHFRYNMLGAGAIVLLVFSLVFSIVGVVYLFHRSKANTEQSEETVEEEKPKNVKLYKRILLVFEWISLGLFFTIFFVPIFASKSNNKTTSYFLINAMVDNTYPIYIYIFFIIFFLAFLASLMYVITNISYYKSDKLFVKRTRNSIFGNMLFTVLFFLTGYFMVFYTNIKKGDATTISYIPSILSVGIYLALSVVQGKLGFVFEDKKKNVDNKAFKLEPLIYVVVLTVITFVSMFFNVIEIHMNAVGFKNDVTLTGYKLLTTYKDLSVGFQLMAFLLFAVLFGSAVLLVLSLVSFFSKYKDCYRIIKISAFANFFFMLLIGLFGTYYKIAQKINEENILSLLNSFHITLPADYTYEVSSQSIYVFFASLAVIILMMVRGQLNQKSESSEGKLIPDSKIEPEIKPAVEQAVPQFDFDACPAFTELDSKLEQFKKELEERRTHLFENLTLPNLVRFVVDYARECRLHLSYSLEDIATFVAGLGASRLTILQGMSGTGKTSLPKIFAEAILGTCEVVEVESSWRDKNELLGYYNEFSKCFTPKKFTQCLYKARLNAEIPTFIVLDEMNLSRIEYYFSDFLSLMEHEEHLRKIKLLNVKLYRTINNQQISYYGLTEDHTIDIPTNVWFIGTANRDESTFEISDKVYDRAQTMNFNKRAPKIHSFSEPLDQRFVTYEGLARLFEEAKQTYEFEAEDNLVIQKVEKILAPYNISFGNRILKQMEEFVKIYCACFGDKEAVLNDAVEKILLSKVVSKLEVKIVENKEGLASEFDKLGLSMCSAFVRKLNED